MFSCVFFFRSGTSEDEMCNFYIMYYMDSQHAVPYMDCMEPGPSALFRNIPDEANVPIPVPAGHMMMGMMHGGGHGTGWWIFTYLPFDRLQALYVGHVMYGQGMGHALRAREILVILSVLSREGQ